MASYVRRRQAVDAVQFIPDKEVPEGVERNATYGWHTFQTLSGPMRIDPGDWIVTTHDGIRFRVAADLFPKMFQAIEGD